MCHSFGVCCKHEVVQIAVETLKPVACPLCREKFPDVPTCDQHYNVIHSKGMQSSQHLTPKELSVAQLKKELKNRGLSTTGNNDILSRNLEGCLASQV